ncbi:MAG: hypothetical protein WCC37_14270 [Candidatus Sulfotelmatobacter sp.]|jgi:hypothetical protein
MSTLPKNRKAATAENSASVVTCIAPAQLQPDTARDLVTGGTAPALAGGAATPTRSRSGAASGTQVTTPVPTDGTSASAEVPAKAPGVQPPPIVPLPANQALAFLGVKPNIADMMLDEKFACLKQCLSYGYGIRKVLCEVFESNPRGVQDLQKRPRWDAYRRGGFQAAGTLL